MMETPIDVNNDDHYTKVPEGKEDKATEQESKSTEWVLMSSQVVLLLIWTFCCRYGEGIYPKTAEVAPVNSNVYPCFQDVNVMIFIGFGYLMSYIAPGGQTALSFNWIISIWCIQWGILSQAFFQQIFSDAPSMTYIDITLESLIWGLFAAATAMITYGALLGKCSLQQLLILTWLEMMVWGLNVAVCLQALSATDMGGSIIIHAFGCFFGLAASYHFQPTRASNAAANMATHGSEIIAMLGSIFLWMFWPSFNGALAAEGNQQQRVFINTNLSIAAGCIGAAFTARLFYGKLEMTIIMNATLAGGVAIGTCSDIITSPAGAMWVGFVAGIISAIGFEKMGPYLAEKINLQDTCGVFYLHGQPGLLGGIASIVAVATLAGQFDKSYFPAIAAGGSKSDQVLAQVWMILVTLGAAIFSGYFGGYIAKRSCFQQPDVLFKDDDHMHDVVSRMPQSYIDLDKKDD